MLREFRARLVERAAIVTLAAAAPLATSTPVAGQSSPTRCWARHYAAYADAQRDYQRTVERVVVGRDPSLRELAVLVRAEQIARIDARQRALETLLATAPSRVRVSRRVNEWLDWGPNESEQLARSDSVYARLDSTARAATVRMRDHPDWAKLRGAVRGWVQSTPEHRGALERLIAAMNAKLPCDR